MRVVKGVKAQSKRLQNSITVLPKQTVLLAKTKDLQSRVPGMAVKDKLYILYSDGETVCSFHPQLAKRMVTLSEA